MFWNVIFLLTLLDQDSSNVANQFTAQSNVAIKKHEERAKIEDAHRKEVSTMLRQSVENSNTKNKALLALLSKLSNT